MRPGRMRENKSVEPCPLQEVLLVKQIHPTEAAMDDKTIKYFKSKIIWPGVQSRVNKNSFIS